MGAFHCPIGAAAPNTAGCIRCGLCTAQTQAEFAAASQCLRTYLKEHAPHPAAIRKIAVCGKGGVGKSTISALLARVLANFGYRVLIMDTDESNPSLSRSLGLSEIPKPLRNVKTPGKAEMCGMWILADSFTIDDIPTEYLATDKNLSLITVGKVEDPFQGCACTLGVLARELMQNLVLQDGEILIADIEAGLESFGRGVERGADTVIAVLEPTMDSLDVAARVQYMAEGVGISRIRAIVNKSPSDKVSDILFSRLIDRGIRYLGAIPTDPATSLHALDGSVIQAEDPIYQAVLYLTELLLDENAMDHPLL